MLAQRTECVSLPVATDPQGTGLGSWIWWVGNVFPGPVPVLYPEWLLFIRGTCVLGPKPWPNFSSHVSQRMVEI